MEIYKCELKKEEEKEKNSDVCRKREKNHLWNVSLGFCYKEINNIALN